MGKKTRAKIYDMLESIGDEALLNQVKEDIEFYVTKKDITDGLTKSQLKQLDYAIREADKKQVIGWDEFKNEMSGWRKR